LSRHFSPEEDTIAAISTPFGESGIGIVRLSGPSAEKIARRLFKPKREFTRLISHQLHYGEIFDPGNGDPVDEVLLVLMKAPRSYTREDIVEIQCHGGSLVLQRILDLALKEGARIALPGEFTKRAFLNGRIDLTQAEAVIDLIRAKTTAGLEIASQQLKGGLYRELHGLKSRLIEHLAFIEAHIDFPEDEIEPIPLNEMEKDLKAIIEKLEEWIISYEEGKIFREGVSCAIAGKTNVGKSSLLNVLLREERAIVTPIPGTTRDVIEEVLNICGIPVRLMDTAGLRKTVDSVEQEGVKKARERVAECDLVLLMLDGGRALEADDREIFEEVKKKRKVVVINKNDLPLAVSLEEMEGLFPEDPRVSISALRGEGIETLKEAIHASLIRRNVRASAEHQVIANIRHKVAFGKGKEYLLSAVKGLEERTSLEFVAFEIRSALEALGEVVGETTTEEVLNRIFEKFCVGK
jgi:tRNA modification GTPase